MIETAGLLFGPTDTLISLKSMMFFITNRRMLLLCSMEICDQVKKLSPGEQPSQHVAERRGNLLANFC
jgi:hypothetical protein